MDASVFFATLPELNAKLKAKEFSAVELVRAFAERLERMGPRYNALALSLSDPAARRAKEIDGDIKRERFRGMLQGIPYGAKDLLAVKGQPTTWGAKPFAAQVFDYDAAVIKKLERAAAVLTAKLSMVELAGGGGYRYPAASLQGPGINPWDTTRWSGGSSSGSGSAVAAGLVPFAIGSETSGSILTPAAYCGVTGLRPSYGLVSRHGAMALSWTMDKIGPLARSADDCGHILQAIAGGDANDPGSAGKSFYYVPQFARQMKDIRIGYAAVDFAEWPDPEVVPVVQKAFDEIKALGVQLMEVKMPDLPIGAMTSVIIGAEGASIFQELIESGKVDELADKHQIAGLKANLELKATDYLKAMRVRSLLQRDMKRIFGEVDILIAPARNSIASKLTDPLNRGGAGRPSPKDRGLQGLIPAGNLAGLPALCLPCGFADKMPVALQLVGPAFTENQLIAVGKAYQAKTEWHKQKPPGA